MRLRRFSFFTLGLLSLMIWVSACSRQPTPEAVATDVSPTSGLPEVSTPPTETLPGTEPGAAESEALTRTDEQGQVVVVVTPLNLESPGQTLDFEVSMSTHSVDLSMNLAELATLTTDTGKSAVASHWDGPSGGHHVLGTLSFPVEANGGSILDGAKTIMLKIADVGVPERIFEWTLQ
ncbi:MAG: hypothetical protein EHM70_05270 [Chloroflexota bacterium]|nr:MAG: hypothetical protein EHM70_05270 [Chloroflexota bacterium]